MRSSKPGANKPILTFLQQTQYELITFPVYHFWGDFRHYRVDRWWHPARGRTACLYRYQSTERTTGHPAPCTAGVYPKKPTGRPG